MYVVNTSVPKTLVKFIRISYTQMCGSDALRNVLFSLCDTPISPELTPSENGIITQKMEEKIGKHDLYFFSTTLCSIVLDPPAVWRFRSTPIRNPARRT